MELREEAQIVKQKTQRRKGTTRRNKEERNGKERKEEGARRDGSREPLKEGISGITQENRRLFI